MTSDIFIWRSTTSDVMSLLIDGLGWWAVGEETAHPVLVLPDRGLATVGDYRMDPRRHREPNVVRVGIHPGDGDRDVVTDQVFHLITKRTWWPVETWSGSGMRRARLRTPGRESPRIGRSMRTRPPDG